MKKLLLVLIGVCLVSITHAEIIKFHAEEPKAYPNIAGDNWQTVEDVAADGGAYITAINNGTTHNAANDRHYEIPLDAATYNVYIRAYIGPNAADDDSCYVPTNEFGADAPMSDWNSVSGDAIDGESIDETYGWARLEESYNDNPRFYPLESDATVVWKLSTREDGFRIDSIAFVTEGQVVTGEDLDNAPFIDFGKRGQATDPVPADESTTVDSEATTTVSWLAPVDPNLVSVDGYDVYFGTDPNIIENPMTSVTTESLLVTLTYETDYYWRVDTDVTWDSNDISGTGSLTQTVEGSEWMFTTLPDDKMPVVTAGSDVLTAPEFLPASLTGTVDDWGEGDIASIAWEVIGTEVPNAAMQMITRDSAAALANLAEIAADPNLLMDWIGTDTRQVGNPMVLTLKGLPADTYSWTSYHHDPDATVMGMFDTTVLDASGSTVTTDIQIGDSNTLPVGTFTTSITANGTDDVILIFDLHPYVNEFNEAWFVMNGFELTGTGDPLNIDFGNTGTAPMPGYQAYEADHEVAATFTEQSYSAFSTTVSVLPTWGGVATVTDTTNDPSSASQTATLTTEWPGSYIVQLSATDSTAQTGSDTVIVTVAANACDAAQLSTSWTEFNISDFNEDCVVNLEDFADLAAGWLDDRNLTAQE